MINKVIPDLIPTFDVALARSYEPKLVDFENDTWYGSRKLDGVRCIIILDKNGVAKAYSRNGKEFETLGKVLKSIESIGSKHLVFDGELCLIDDEGNEDFQGVFTAVGGSPGVGFLKIDAATRNINYLSGNQVSTRDLVSLHSGSPVVINFLIKSAAANSQFLFHSFQAFKGQPTTPA